MSGDLDTLVSFGFERSRAEWALKSTKNAGLQPALDFLQTHEDDATPDASSSSSSSIVEAPASQEEQAAEAAADADEAAGVQAKSIKCLECGKIFRNTALAGFHGDRSGHDQFEESTEEIKPLTDEEKRAKLEELRAKMAAKRKVKEEQDRADAKANEAIRRKAGQDQGAAKAQLKLKEAEKQALERKNDKILEAKAKARVREQIEEDKRKRAEKAAKDKALREGRPPPDTTEAAPKAAAAASAPAAKRVHSEARLQLRLPANVAGAPVLATFPADKTLNDVANHLYDAVPSLSGNLAFSTTFPRKTFTKNEMASTLGELQLTPSSRASRLILLLTGRLVCTGVQHLRARHGDSSQYSRWFLASRTHPRIDLSLFRQHHHCEVGECSTRKTRCSLVQNRLLAYRHCHVVILEPLDRESTSVEVTRRVVARSVMSILPWVVVFDKAEVLVGRLSLFLAGRALA
ncbi:hypothetical protein E5Q_00597 [Mixia osmundae IAM 14324]|uniref:UBA domain-containing protein n=1 Tax=Mixia osmundae (strain CBS 9802 / IAM 14324 / JCM 22182 / KY 12970) TaxID=764103 RepID=G7DT72_MIXOS|nr:hypothetical protein E5Q_00597 [Mixia osmundae IAM 14324]